MISVNIAPREMFLKTFRGGVKEHMRHLYRELKSRNDIKIVEHEADIYHVESSYTNVRTDVYVCHGGFLPPPPMRIVEMNLSAAKTIVTVAQWIADEFFPEYADKTVHIPNGVDLAEFDNLPPSGLKPGYVLYAKEYVWNMEEFCGLVDRLRKEEDNSLSFVSTVWPHHWNYETTYGLASNLEIIGLQEHQTILSIMKDAGCVVLTGSEVCPTILLEAWACGTPVVALDTHGNAEIMRRNNEVFGGLLYNDAEELEYAIRSCVENKDYFGQIGREIVEQDYQWKDLAERYVEQYKKLL